MGFLQDLQNRILIADGAMGTLLYSYGVDFCFEELNLLQPDRITQIHETYIKAGADVIQTNTYGANYIKLGRYGLEDQVKDINTAAVRLAKKAAKENTYVLGTFGGIRGIKKSAATIDEIKRSFREQLYSILMEGVDGLLLETFYDFDEIKTVLEIARKETDLPIISQVSIHEVAVLQDGTPLRIALKELEDLGADVVGLNCRLGPHHMTQALEEVPLPKKAFLSAYPNASLPDYVDGRLIYESDAEYFGECAVNLRNQGVRLIGGCCGTTPKHIKAVSKRLKGLAPVTHKDVKIKENKNIITVTAKPTQPHLHEIVTKERSVIVELDTPKTLNTTAFIEGAKALKEVGIDALTMADNSLASPRISNMAMAAIVKNEVKIRPLVHITCRDRNLIGLQSHLMGLDALGIDQVLAVTGDPTKVGDFPGATSVYDLSSFELISLIKQFNEGITFSGKPLQKKTSFSVAAAFNPNVRHLDKAVKRLEKKIEHGADYFISQPIFNEQQFLHVYEETKHITKPIYIGIMPIVSSQNAEFLHNEVPGIKLTDVIRRRMADCGTDREKAAIEGIAIAKSLIDMAFDLFKGIYLITPFMRYEISVELVQYLKTKNSKNLLTRN
ncbi:bifunctional homocysteine S-methyltransferase/methylenetetrahydrofolate reductase [Schinkia azotoformans]|uniref:Bifunctional homocysteine S-methyltransferase/5,10-methylenetetrahydrofolate reductase protein n=1 Tax=Schinkia azotoformans LMG 9581 TaxID=1131731 RepID=K6DRA7_SCHAZ|nr:bifunctional homocysteine S-methyltransferase/methylenetetrahydrofolate reductase [Schinkia azotoformans]EKN63321.1 bifunctional homocysteine S-methyltransferase/5,10-methylenetetrahydrofolate reductase protein [Schinkia azotoformans LMG 9581]MEC1640403.1 bifunctional homocysteine S-methyltransferase/methylenetetrahydrofolate reductase [Schinkia azotoformans]MEC1946587.1 bifunctional homocysteine S-methyltransferase/methylenetetrahydrofolate reductase [Schinkia azotoformans]